MHEQMGKIWKKEKHSRKTFERNARELVYPARNEKAAEGLPAGDGRTLQAWGVKTGFPYLKSKIQSYRGNIQSNHTMIMMLYQKAKLLYIQLNVRRKDR